MTETVTGTEISRQAARARAKSQNIATMARELGVPTEALYEFGNGQGTLPVPVLQALTVELFHGHAKFLPEQNLLAPVNKNEPTPMGIPPDRYVPPPDAPRYQGGPPPLYPAKKGSEAFLHCKCLLLTHFDIGLEEIAALQ